MREKTQEKNYLTFKFYIDDFVLKIPFKLSFCLGFTKINSLPFKGYLYAKSNMREKTQEKNYLTFKYYVDDIMLKIPFKLGFCLGFANLNTKTNKLLYVLTLHCTVYTLQYVPYIVFL